MTHARRSSAAELLDASLPHHPPWEPKGPRRRHESMQPLRNARTHRPNGTSVDLMLENPTTNAPPRSAPFPQTILHPYPSLSGVRNSEHRRMHSPPRPAHGSSPHGSVPLPPQLAPTECLSPKLAPKRERCHSPCTSKHLRCAATGRLQLTTCSRVPPSSPTSHRCRRARPLPVALHRAGSRACSH